VAAKALGRVAGSADATSTRGEHLGQQHSHRLEVLDLRRLVAARVAVLHRDDAEHATGAAQRHGEHRREEVLAGLAAIGEGRVVLRVRQVERLAGRGDQTDDALADPQMGPAHGFLAQADGGGKLQHLAGAHDVDRADLGDEFRGHQAGQLPERRRAARGQRPQTGQEAAGGGGKRHAGLGITGPCRERKRGGCPGGVHGVCIGRV
jgi:hypothetical protein